MEKGAWDPLPKSKWRKEPKEIITTNFNSKETKDVSYKEDHERRSVESKSHDLVERLVQKKQKIGERGGSTNHKSVQLCIR